MNSKFITLCHAFKYSILTETKGDMILETLLDSFKQFKLNYISLPKLIREL